MSAKSEAAHKATHDESVKAGAAPAAGTGPLIRDRRIVADDYATLADDAPLPKAGAVIVSWARWQAEAPALRASGRTVGVRIPNTLDLAGAAGALADRPLVALEFPAYSDGRAYSQARLLRERYGYRGEIRATGAAVQRDHLFGMARCGIDAFELRADQDPAACLAAFGDFSLAYQAAADAEVPLWRRRAG